MDLEGRQRWSGGQLSIRGQQKRHLERLRLDKPKRFFERLRQGSCRRLLPGPPTDTGFLQVWSNPALNDDWGDWCSTDGAGSDGWVGLYIGEYVVDGGGFVGAPVDQQISLWSDSSWWSGVGSQEGSSSGYPLFAQLNVDNDHFYEIWVWGGTDVYGAGWSTFWGSAAGGDLSASVPSITWELY